MFCGVEQQSRCVSSEMSDMTVVDRVVLTPHLTRAAGTRFVEAAAALSLCEASQADEVRDAWLARVSPGAVEGQILRVCVSVLADLRAQGWEIGRASWREGGW